MEKTHKEDVVWSVWFCFGVATFLSITSAGEALFRYELWDALRRIAITTPVLFGIGFASCAIVEAGYWIVHRVKRRIG